MMIRPAKTLLYLIEFLNCYAAVYYSNFLFFYLRNAFGFGELENLLTAAAGGVVYIFASWQGGKLAQRYGCIRLLVAGACIVIVSLSMGLAFPSSGMQVLVYGLWTAGICLIWPALETLISEGSGARLPQMVGIYNVTWAGSAAVAYFTTGILIEQFGMASLFWIPLWLTGIELALLPLVANRLKKEAGDPDAGPSGPAAHHPSAVHHPDAKRFLRLAWIANPFSYVAINTVIPLIPSITERLGLSTGMAGVVCSLWMFARLAAFAAFWHWRGWHYRFRWLAAACFLMIVCFFAFLLTHSISVLLLAQIGFGGSIGLIYYSSLYYSMNVTENQGKNAGVHEAMIGVGLFAGPAAGAATLFLFPASAAIGVWSVGGLLCAGFCALVFVRRYRPQRAGAGRKKWTT